MIKNLFFALMLLITSVLTNSCDNTLDILSEYKDTTVVYAILNPADTAQYIRIHKMYLGPGNAINMAQVPDSIYPPNVLDVRLERYKNGLLAGIIPFFRDSNIIEKDSGLFAQYPNILYKSGNFDSVYYDSEYYLRIHNKQTGKDVTAKTNIVGKIIVQNPSLNAFEVDFLANPYIVSWYAASNGVLYEVIIRFYYKEAPISNPNQSVTKYVDWHLGLLNESDKNSFNLFEYKIQQNEFFAFVGSAIKTDVTLQREAGHVDFIFVAGNEDLYDYYRINNLNSSLSQTIPSYTNIYGGLGIFASRYQHIIYDRPLEKSSVDSLKYGSYTLDLNFVK